VVFSCWADNLVPDDGNPNVDVFVRERLACGATVASYCVASPTSVPGCVAAVSGQGTPSLSAPGGFTIASGPIPGGSRGMLRFGLSGSSSDPLGTLGGRLCVAPPLFPLPLRLSGGVPGTCGGLLAYTLDELIAAHPGVVVPGATVHAAFLFRDPASPDGFSSSNGLWFQVCP
jgi:hypothetical protein